MSKTNSKLSAIIANTKPKANLVKANNIPKPDTTNLQGKEAYSQDKWLTLLTMLNTLKFEHQYYRSTAEQFSTLAKLIQECGKENLYLTCQCIVYSRCLGEGMRAISHAASVLIAPYISGQEYSKRFYSLWNKKEKKGGVIFRPDDMFEILQGYISYNTNAEGKSTKLSNAMKKGFKSVLESLDEYSLLKYKSSLIDVINLVHPSSKKSTAVSQLENGDTIKTIDAIMRGLPVKANTWETNQSEAGQIVAQAVKEGKLSEKEAKETLTQAKADNWAELLDTNKLGILAAIRNIRNILINNPNANTVGKLAALLSNSKAILEGKIFPYQLDIANDVLMSEFKTSEARIISQALALGYASAVPNLKELLPGRNLVILDQSGSMCRIIQADISLKGRLKVNTSCAQKAALIAATIAKATNADIIIFGSTAKYYQYNPNLDVFTLAKEFNKSNMGRTNLSAAWRCANNSGIKYDRVFILSDNECNVGSTYTRYMNYVREIGSPYVYSVDLAGYGTNCIAGDKVRYYYGYGFSMFEDIAKSEFKAEYHLEKVKQVEI